MKISKISVKNDGYVHCHSSFYTSHDGLDKSMEYHFSLGVNKMNGEIDSEIWAISYLLSMYKYKPKDFVLFGDLSVTINDDTVISLEELSRYSCYMDKCYPLFSGKTPVNKLIMKAIQKNKLDCTPDDIRELFMIDEERFKRPLTGVGNEIFKAMAAIGYCHGKEVFCFPWLSDMRFKYYHGNMTFVLDSLERLNKIIILPVGNPECDCCT